MPPHAALTEQARINSRRSALSDPRTASLSGSSVSAAGTTRPGTHSSDRGATSRQPPSLGRSARHQLAGDGRAGRIVDFMEQPFLAARWRPEPMTWLHHHASVRARQAHSPATLLERSWDRWVRLRARYQFYTCSSCARSRTRTHSGRVSAHAVICIDHFLSQLLDRGVCRRHVSDRFWSSNKSSETVIPALSSARRGPAWP